MTSIVLPHPKVFANEPTKIRLYKLEKLTIKSSERISKELIENEIGLIKGLELNNRVVLEARAKLISLGLFKSVILYMKKGSKKGWAELVVHLEDDEHILTDWAIGGTLGARYSERQTRLAGTESNPMGFQLELVSRNIFKSLHRGSFRLDIDDEGAPQEVVLAYGLPRFTTEQMQFDARISAIDVGYRYLDALGFGGFAEGIWSQPSEDYGQFLYGVAMYVNPKGRFAVPSYPTSVAGPKIGFRKETRLNTFISSPGYKYETFVVPSVFNSKNTLAEFGFEKTFGFWQSNRFSLGARALNVGGIGYSFRGNAKLDIPFKLGGIQSQDGVFYIKLQNGSDERKQTKLKGSAGILGLKLHSSGFIADLSLQITKSPEELTSTPLTVPGEIE